VAIFEFGKEIESNTVFTADHLLFQRFLVIETAHFRRPVGVSTFHRTLHGMGVDAREGVDARTPSRLAAPRKFFAAL
jgi:hypothetical protein